MLSYEEKELIEDKRKELEERFPNMAAYCSRCTLWTEGLRAGIVEKELYDKARAFYGRLWTYVGD